MNDTTAVKPADNPVPGQQPQRMAISPVSDDSEFAQLLDSDRFAQIQRVAKLFSESDLVPEVFQGKPANCAVALQMAFRMRVDPMMLMQNMYIVKGRPGIEAKLAIALMNSRGPFKGPLQWKQEGEGDARSWTCFAVHRATQGTCEATVTWAMVKAEGWDKPRGKEGGFQQPSKWTTIPDIMGKYRSAMILGRLYCPEVLLGLPSDEELRDMPDEVLVAGERIDKGAARARIAMPQAKAIEAEPVSPAVDSRIQREPETVDVLTGEVIKATDDVKPLEVGAKATPKIDPTVIASDAQKRAIEATGKRLNLPPSQIDEIIVDATGFSLSNLPQAMVNNALQALARPPATR